MELKVCEDCWKAKDIECFGFNHGKHRPRCNKCKDCRKEDAKRWKHGNREKYRERGRELAKLNPEKYAAKSRRIREIKMLATPTWANHELIKAIYAKAKEKGMEVDHIVPLDGKIVCGLHCHHNLQLLTAEENKRKHNRWWPDMP